MHSAIVYDVVFQPYLIALGKVAHSWNHLHDELGKLFCAVTSLDLSVGMAIWHSLKSDRGQRDILEGAVQARARDEDWLKDHPGAEAGVLFLTKKVQSLSEAIIYLTKVLGRLVSTQIQGQPP